MNFLIRSKTVRDNLLICFMCCLFFAIAHFAYFSSIIIEIEFAVLKPEPTLSVISYKLFTKN